MDFKSKEKRPSAACDFNCGEPGKAVESSFEASRIKTRKPQPCMSLCSQ
jgi:hypothetical protein